MDQTQTRAKEREIKERTRGKREHRRRMPENTVNGDRRETKHVKEEVRGEKTNGRRKRKERWVGVDERFVALKRIKRKVLLERWMKGTGGFYTPPLWCLLSSRVIRSIRYGAISRGNVVVHYSRPICTHGESSPPSSDLSIKVSQSSKKVPPHGKIRVFASYSSPRNRERSARTFVVT